MTDLEGMAPGSEFYEWIKPGQPRYPVRRDLLMREINRCWTGSSPEGAQHVVVSDAHGRVG